MSFRERIIPLIGAVIVTGVTINPAEAHWCYNGSKLNTIERAICSDTSLIDKDRELNRLYKSLGGRSNSGLKAAQRSWMRGRNGCTSMACLHSYYDNRLNALRTMSGGYAAPVAPPSPPPVVTFTPPPPPVDSVPVPTQATRPQSPPAAPSPEKLEKLPDIKPF